MSPEDLFADLQNRVAANPGLIDEVGCIYQFNVQGDGGGTWIVDLKNAPGGVTPGPNSDADCVISVGADDFIGIFTGKVDPQMAFMMGRIKVAGNFMLATKLRSLLA